MTIVPKRAKEGETLLMLSTNSSQDTKDPYTAILEKKLENGEWFTLRVRSYYSIGVFIMKSTIDSLSSSFERLSGREQVMTLFLVITVFVFILGISTYFVGRDFERRTKRIAAKSKKLGELQGLRADYQRRLSDQNRLAEKIKKNNDTRLLSYIENVSKQP